MIPGSKACVAGLCQPQWQRDERSCSIESWGSGELHSQNEPVGAAAPKSTTGTQLVGDTSPWTAVSALLLLLGLLPVASFSPVLLSHVRYRRLFASFLVLFLPQAHRGL